MPAPMTAAQLNTVGAEAFDLIEAGSYAAARPKLIALLTAMITLPDVTDGRQRLEYSRDQVEAAVRLVDRELALQNASGGLQQATIVF